MKPENLFASGSLTANPEKLRFVAAGRFVMNPENDRSWTGISRVLLSDGSCEANPENDRLSEGS